jgi:hypothetical protein
MAESLPTSVVFNESVSEDIAVEYFKDFRTRCDSSPL